MAYNYLWTWRWYFAAQYLLVSPRSVGVFSFYSLKIRVNFIVKNWASSNASGGYLPLLFGNLKSLIDPLKTRLKKKTGNCCCGELLREEVADQCPVAEITHRAIENRQQHHAKGIVRTTAERIYCRFGGNSSYSGNPPGS